MEESMTDDSTGVEEEERQNESNMRLQSIKWKTVRLETDLEKKTSEGDGGVRDCRRDSGIRLRRP